MSNVNDSYSIIRIVEDKHHISSRQLADVNLCAIRHTPDEFTLIKAAKYPNPFCLSHFTNPINLKTLKKYISINLT